MAAPDWQASAAEIEAIVMGHHGDPFAILGLHQHGKRWIARAFVPGAERLSAVLEDGASPVPLERRHDAGVFEGELPLPKRGIFPYRAENAGGVWQLTDAYLFGPVLGPLDTNHFGVCQATLIVRVRKHLLPFLRVRVEVRVRFARLNGGSLLLRDSHAA